MQKWELHLSYPCINKTSIKRIHSLFTHTKRELWISNVRELTANNSKGHKYPHSMPDCYNFINKRASMIYCRKISTSSSSIFIYEKNSIQVLCGVILYRWSWIFDTFDFHELNFIQHNHHKKCKINKVRISYRKLNLKFKRSVRWLRLCEGATRAHFETTTKTMNHFSH